MAWLSGWSYRKSITIDHTKVDADLTDFPILVKLTSSNFDFSKAQSNGNDIRFTSDDGETLLKYERERHDSGSSKAEYWVKIPSVSSSSDTTFYIYYGNSSAFDGADPENVWDSSFKGVWHLDQDPSGTAPQELDSTSNDNDGTSSGSMTSNDLVEGKVGEALDFDGSDDSINCGNNSSLDVTDGISLEAWIKADSWDTSSANTIIRKNDAYILYQNQGNLDFYLYGPAHRLSYDISNLSTGTWYHIAATYDKQNMRIYVNGAEVTSAAETASIATSTHALGIGANITDTTYFFNGIIDEVCLLNLAHSAAWIKASFNSENDIFVTFGGEEVANYFNGKVNIKNVAANLLDGKTEVYIGGIPNYDGKVKIVISPTLLLDGKVDVNTPTDLLDGKAVIQSGTPSLLDGKVDVKDVVAALLDGKTRIKNSTIDLFDGKVHPIYKIINLFDGKVHPVYSVANILDGKVAPTDRLGNLNAYAPLPSTIFKLGGHIVNDVPRVDSSILGVFRYAKMEASLFPFSFQALIGSRIIEKVPGFSSNITASNPHVGIINGYLEPLYGIFRTGAGIGSKVDLYGCAIYADTANVSNVNGYIPGVISLSSGDSEDIAKVLGSIVSPNGSFSGFIGNVGSMYGRIPYLLQVIEASPGIVSSIIGEASSIGATITASRSGDIIIISDIPSIKWHSSVNNGVKCVILKYVRSV